MIGIYFSGTGNTRFCVRSFLDQLGEDIPMYSIEDAGCITAIMEHNDIILGYPIYYSNLPKIMRDFMDHVSAYWKGKNVYIIATMGLFSGDGAGVGARILKKYGADIAGGLHLKMPDCIGDVKVLKKPLERNKLIVAEAAEQVRTAAARFTAGNPTRNGLGLCSHLAGLFGQRLYFYGKALHYTNKLKIDVDSCIGCGVCAENCPMNNIEIKKGRAFSKNSCTMCYRCINSCPKSAITLLGKSVIEQCRIERYM